MAVTSLRYRHLLQQFLAGIGTATLAERADGRGSVTNPADRQP